MIVRRLTSLIIGLVGVLIIAYLALVILVSALSRATVVESLISWLPQAPIHGVNILVFGTDNNDRSHRADAIMIAHLDTVRNRTGVISVPRDTRVYIDGVGISKINHAFAHGGADLLKDTLSHFLNIPIHHYIQLDTSQVAQIIDYIGGIDITVEKDLNYTDLAGGLAIDINMHIYR